MQVILLQDVANVGKKFEEVEVADGYGTNYLIPNGLAQVATEETRKRYERQQKKAEEKRRKEREELAKTLEDLDGGEVVISVSNVGDQGQLFAGIYPKDIAAAVNDEFDTEITGADIDRDQPISKVGENEIDISILDTTISVTVVVEADGQAGDNSADDANAEDDSEEPEISEEADGEPGDEETEEEN